jgi:hypothetical protein
MELTGGLLRGEGQRAGFFLLASFLISFLFIRTSARLMRSPRVPWWPGSITTSGGLHIHHLVLGLALVLVSGFLSLLLLPDTPWREVLAVAFGAGAGLVLDEFALLVYLRDVYWSDEGRASVDAVVLAALLTSLAVLGVAPLDAANTEGSIAAVAGVGALALAVSVVALLKGKIVLGMVGLFVPVLAIVGAVRLARPRSPWARRFYSAGSARLARATEREKRLERRRRTWLNRIGGAPSPSATHGGGS